MRQRPVVSIGVPVAVVAILALSSVPAAGQSDRPLELPRTPWGVPDLQGVWDYRTVTPLERPSELAGRAVLTVAEAADFERQAIRNLNGDRRDGETTTDIERGYNNFWKDYGSTVVGERRTSLIVDPPDGRIPSLTVAAQQRQQTRRLTRDRPVRERVAIRSPAHGPEDLGLSERCLLGLSSGPPFTPTAYNNNVQLFQTPDHVVIVTEMIHAARIVSLDGRPHLSQRIRQWLGDSRGHWNGDTLVVTSTNFTNKTGSFNTPLRDGAPAGSVVAALGSGESLHLVERFTRLDADTLLYEFTIADPVTFTRPFTAAIPMKLTEDPMFEYACHEGNYGMFNILAGARARDEAADGPERAAAGRDDESGTDRVRRGLEAPGR